MDYVAVFKALGLAPSQIRNTYFLVLGLIALFSFLTGILIGWIVQISFTEFPQTREELNNFFDQLDWNHPWNAGAQVSGICVFISILENNEDLVSFINEYLEQLLLEDGSYGLPKVSDSSEKVNGAMKVITGLDWLNIPIHRPNELIDLCLKHKPNTYAGKRFFY